MTDLPAVAQEHLYPFLVLGVVFVTGIGVVVRVVLKAQSMSDARTAAIVKAALESRDHRTVIREESVEALRTPAGRDELKLAAHEAAAEALHGMAEPMLSAQADHRRRIESLEASRIGQGTRIGEVEQWKAGAEVILQTVAEHGRKIGQLERWVVAFGGMLKRAGKATSEETGT